jgi:ABC-type glycerol-3-phosphate transport system permease component
MSQELVTCLIAVAVNLIGMMAIYAMMSGAIARRRTWATLLLIFVSQLFWIVPAVWIVEARSAGQAGSYALWLGNWLVSGFSVVLFLKSAARIPVALADTAQMDGLSGFAAWRHAVFPFVRRDFVIVALFTVMATLLPFWGCLTLPEAGSSIALFERFLSPSGRLAFMGAMSIAGAIPILAIFFLAKLEGRALSRPVLAGTPQRASLH